MPSVYYCIRTISYLRSPFKVTLYFFCSLCWSSLWKVQSMINHVELYKAKILHPKGLAVLSKVAHWWQNFSQWSWLATLAKVFFRKIHVYNINHLHQEQIPMETNGNNRAGELRKTWARQTWMEARESGKEQKRKPNASQDKDDQLIRLQQ